jgi:ATP-dependent helicase/nuclease subunit B
MPDPFPPISETKITQTWFIEPNATALAQLAVGVWTCAKQTQQRPVVVLSTAGPLIGLRAALEANRPEGLDPSIAFLPQVLSFSDWLEAAPGAWKFPKKQSDLERWLAVYATLKKHPKLQTWFRAEGEAGAWGLAQAIIDACDTLSSSVAPYLQAELSELIGTSTNRRLQEVSVGEGWLQKLEPLLEATIAKAYSALARKVLDQEAQVLLTFWRYTGSASDPAFRNQFAMAAHLERAKLSKENKQKVRPLIWVETADPTPIDREIIETLLQSYAQYAQVTEVKMDWQKVGLWAETISISENEHFTLTTSEKQAAENTKKASFKNWRLIAAKRFEELAWATAKTIEQHLMDGKTNIALVAQDRLVARRVRALLTRLGPSLRIQDETGWKLSTTRAAAALNSWLELLRSPKEGPTAIALLEFLQNPFLNLKKCLNKENVKDGAVYVGLVAQLEDILIASQAHSGWETFYLAIEGARSNALKKGSDEPNPALLELLQFVRGRHHAWLGMKVDCTKAYEQLHADLQRMGMTTGLEKDSAGKQLLEALTTFDLRKTGHQQLSMRLSEWLSLLKTIIEEANYQEVGREAFATLSILPLSSTRLRSFEAVVVVGCDEQQLPAFSQPPLFFSDALNRLLKGSTVEAQFIQQARDLSQLLASCESVALLWQSKSGSGEPLRPSAWIQRLQTQIDWHAEEPKPKIVTGNSKPMTMAVAILDANMPMPGSMSPSAYKALRDCPYRYYVRSLLGLRQIKSFDEGFDASLAGQTLHAVLKTFFHALRTKEQQLSSQINSSLQQKNSDARRVWMQAELMSISEKIFKRLVDGDARVLGTLRDWQKQVPSFVEWQLQRESQGWEYLDGEVKVGFDLRFYDEYRMEKHIRIEGYADRFDVHVGNTKVASVIDYKNQSFDRVKLRADHILDDPQLLIYARAANQGDENHKICGRDVRQAEWVALKADLSKHDDKVLRVLEVQNMSEVMAEFSVQLTEDIEQLWSRKPMQAFAPDGVCKYCDVRGICRKGMW